MDISLSTLKENPAKYFELAKTTEIIVTQCGERIGRIISETNNVRSDRQRAVEALIGSVDFPDEYGDPDYDVNYDSLRDAAYRDKGLL